MKRALISVSNKSGLIEFARGLVAENIEIISTGGTQAYLAEAGIKTIGIEAVTGFPEILDGRVKTLHPKIHGGLLAKRQVASHSDALRTHEIQWLDYVCVNLYPFKETIMQVGTTLEEAVEQIDIGGPSMLRSGAKNFAAVTVVVDPADYGLVLSELTQQAGTTYETRKRLAAKVFRHTAAYDALIASYLTETVGERQPEKLTVTYEKKQALRYGENPQQKASFYQNTLPVPFSLGQAKQLHGKELSYNNIRDADAALQVISEFSEPTAVAVKHMNPCGVGVGKNILTAYTRAYEADPTSIFGGILALNREIDSETAEKMSELFLELIIAPSFSAAALVVLRQKKNIRLLTVSFPTETAINQAKPLELTTVLGGLLVQEADQTAAAVESWQVVTEARPTSAEIKALAFAWKVVKHVKSNGIVIATKEQTIGIGAGQMNRIGAVKIAIQQGQTVKGQLETAVMASDAFFPMADSIVFAAEHGIKAIIQPGGSIKDQLLIDQANELGIAMIFTGVRHFKH